MAAGYVELNAWTANYINIILPHVRDALDYWRKRYSTTDTKVIQTKSKESKPSNKTITVPFTFNQSYATQLLNGAVNELGAARVNLVGILSSAGVSPGVSGELLSSFDKAAKPLYDFQKNTAGAIPASTQPLSDWYLKNLRPLLLKLMSSR